FSGYENQIDKSRLTYHIDGGVREKVDTTKPMFQIMYYQNLRGMRAAIDKYAKYPEFMRNIAISGVSTNLFSDFKRNNIILRDQMKEEIEEILALAKDSFNKLVLYDPNIYAV